MRSRGVGVFRRGQTCKFKVNTKTALLERVVKSNLKFKNQSVKSLRMCVLNFCGSYKYGVFGTIFLGR